MEQYVICGHVGTEAKLSVADEAVSVEERRDLVGYDGLECLA